MAFAACAFCANNALADEAVDWTGDWKVTTTCEPASTATLDFPADFKMKVEKDETNNCYWVTEFMGYGKEYMYDEGLKLIDDGDGKAHIDLSYNSVFCSWDAETAAATASLSMTGTPPPGSTH